MNEAEDEAGDACINDMGMYNAYCTYHEHHTTFSCNASLR